MATTNQTVVLQPGTPKTITDVINWQHPTPGVVYMCVGDTYDHEVAYTITSTLPQTAFGGTTLTLLSTTTTKIVGEFTP